MLLESLYKELDQLGNNDRVMLKLTLPEKQISIRDIEAEKILE